MGNVRQAKRVLRTGRGACDSGREGDYMRMRVFAAGVLFLAAFLMDVVLGADGSSGTVPLAPPPINVPPPPAAAVAQDWEGYGIAGSGKFIVIGRPGRDIPNGGTNASAAGQVVVWDVEEGYLSRSWTIDCVKPRVAEFFGGAVAAGDRWIAVSHGLGVPGVPYDVSPGQKTNRVQLLEFRGEEGWVPGPDLPTGGARLSQFGQTLVMQGSRLVVGSSSAAYVYDVSPQGVWTLTQTITAPPSAGQSSAFGAFVAMYGDLLVVGANGFPNVAGNGYFSQQGRAYVYRWGQNGLYSLETDFVAPDAAEGDAFGASVAVEILEDAEVIAIGAPAKDLVKSQPTPTPNMGAVYMYRRDLPNGEWRLEQELTNFFGSIFSNLGAGARVALHHGRLAVSAGEGVNEGVEFHYRTEAGNWVYSGDGTVSSDRYGHGLVSFEHGFLIGRSGRNSNAGAWEWRSTNPYLGFLNAPGVALAGQPLTERRADADPDGDGLPNSEELFFGTDPLAGNTNQVVRPNFDGASGQFRMQWQEAAQTYGLLSKVAWTTNLFGGIWQTNSLQIVTLPSDAGSTNKKYEARLPAGGRTNLFFRLVVQ